MAYTKIEQLYDTLINKGYTSELIGDKQKFIQYMNTPERRKRFYDYISANNNLRLPSYEVYEQNIASDYPYSYSSSASRSDGGVDNSQGDSTDRRDAPLVRNENQTGNVSPSAVSPSAEIREDRGSAVGEGVQEIGEVPQGEGVRAYSISQPGKIPVSPQQYYNPSTPSLLRNPSTGQYDINPQFSLRSDSDPVNKAFKRTALSPAMNVETDPTFYQRYRPTQQNVNINEKYRQYNNNPLALASIIYNTAATQALNDNNYYKTAAQALDIARKIEAGELGNMEASHYLSQLISPEFDALINQYLMDEQRKEHQKITSFREDVEAKLSNINETIEDTTPAFAFPTMRVNRIPSEKDKELIHDAALYKTALHNIDKADKRVKATSLRGKRRNGLQELGRGFVDTLFDIDSFTLGLSQLCESSQMIGILNKIDEENIDDSLSRLTDAEKDLLQSAVLLSAVEASNDPGSFYNSGAGAAYSIPFIIDFLITKGAVSGVTKGATDKVIKIVSHISSKHVNRIGNRFGRGLLNTSLRGAANLTNSLIVGTAQMPISTFTYNSILDRYIGDLQYQYDQEDNIQFSGRKHEDLPTAIAKGAASSLITHAVEQFGGELLNDIFSIIGRNTLRNLSAPRSWQLLRDRIAHSGWGHFLNDAGYHGFPGEFFEEIMDQSLNAIVTGDQSLGDVFSSRNLTETAASTLLITTFMGSSTAALTARQRAKINKAYAIAENNAVNLYNASQMQQLNDIAQGNTEKSVSWINSISRHLQSLSEQRDNLYRSLSHHARAILAMPERTQAEIDSLNDSDISTANEIINLDENISQLIVQRDYVIAAANYNAYVRGLRDRIQPQEKIFLQAIDNHAHNNSGYTIEVDYNGRTGYITSGDLSIIPLDNGTYYTQLSGKIYTIAFDTPDGGVTTQQLTPDLFTPNPAHTVPTQQLRDNGINQLYKPIEQQIIQEQQQAQAEIISENENLKTENENPETEQTVSPSDRRDRGSAVAEGVQDIGAIPNEELGSIATEGRRLSRSDGGVNTQSTEQTTTSTEQTQLQTEQPETSTQQQPSEPAPVTPIDLNTLSDDDFDTHIDTLTPTEAIEAISQRRGVEDADQYAHWRKAVLNKQRDAAQRKLNAKHKPFDPSRYNSYPEMKRAEALYNQQISQQQDQARATIDALDKQIADINQYQNRRNAQIAAELREDRGSGVAEGVNSNSQNIQPYDTNTTSTTPRNTQQEATQPTIQPSSQPSDTTPIPQHSQDTATIRPTTTTPTDTGTTRQDVVRQEYDKVSEELFKFTHDYLTNKLGYNFQSEEDFYYWATKKSEKQLAKWLQEKAGLDTKQTLEVIQLLRKYSELRKQLLSNPNTTHQDVVNNHQDIVNNRQDVVEPHQSGEITEMVQPVGQNILGNLFNQFRGKAQEAINFLLNRGEGNAIAALNHPQVGDIDLWYGNDKAGLKKIAQKHPEVLDDLQGIINNMHVVKASDNRIVLESDTHRAIVSKMLGNEKTDNWLLSAYELKSTSAGSSDIDTEPIGMQNGTAALHSTPSDNKDTTSSLNNNNSEQKSAHLINEASKNDDLRTHIASWQQAINAPIVVLSNIHEVNNPQARAAIASATLTAQRYPGWFADGNIYLYLPHCTDTTDIDRTILHECIAHYGVRKLFPSPHSLNRFYDQVWNMMQHNDRQRFLQYPGISNLTGPEARRAAADEYIAHLAEQLHTQGTTITPEQTSIWQRIVSFLRNALRQAGINLRLSDTDLNNLLISSYNNLRNNTSHPSPSTSHTTTMTHPLPSERRVEDYSPSMNNPQQATGEVGGNTTLNQQPSEKTGNTTNTTPIQPLSPSTSDTELDIFLRENRAANDRHREQWKSIPRPRDLEKAYNAGDTQAIEQWKAGWEAFLQQLIPMDLPVIDGTITTASRNKAVKMVQTPHGYKVDKESSAYKAFDYIEKSLKKRKKQLERNLTEEERRTIDIVKRGLRGELNNTRLRAVSETFDSQLQQQIDGTLPAGHIYNLGMPSPILRSAGLPNLPIELAASRLTDKSMQENHPFDIAEVRGLVDAIQDPLAIFRSATHIGSFVVLTEIQHGGRNFVVAIEANRRQGRIEVNSIRSIHYRNSNTHIANWIEDGLLEYAHKERMSEWFSKQRYNSADVRKLFRHTAKIVQNFENPKLPDTRFRFIGVRGATNLDLAEEATTRLDNLAIARSMEQEGRDERTIKLATGWERGADNLWRYEIPDTPINQDALLTKHQSGATITILAELIDDEQLFKAYPELFDMVVAFQQLPLGELGNYSPRNAMGMPANIILSEEFLSRRENPQWREEVKRMEQLPIIKQWSDAMEAETFDMQALEDAERQFKASPLWDEYNTLLEGKGKYPRYITGIGGESTLAHEVQHAIQDIEGFARGGNEHTADHLRDKARVWAWRNALVATEKEHPELAGTTAIEQLLIDEYTQDGLQEYIPTEEQRIKGFNLYVRGYDNEGYQAAWEQMDKIRPGDNRGTYRRLAGEVEARNVANRLNYTPEERANTLARITEDIAREDQIFISQALGNPAMGSRVEQRMKEIATHYQGRTLSSIEQAIIEVFTGNNDNMPISVKTADGNTRRIIMRQGKEQNAGTKHSLFRHYNTGSGVITAEDLLLIPEVIANGTRTEKGKGKIEYRYTHDNGTKYTVLTEIDDRRETFADFYTNRKTSSAARQTHSEEARDTANDVSADKDTTNNPNTQTRFRSIDTYTVTEDIKRIVGISSQVNHSHYVKGTTLRGETWQLRISNHPAAFINIEDHLQDDEQMPDYFTSIVITDIPDVITRGRETLEQQRRRFNNSPDFENIELDQVIIDTRTLDSDNYQDFLDEFQEHFDLFRQTGLSYFNDDYGTRFRSITPSMPDFRAIRPNESITDYAEQIILRTANYNNKLPGSHLRFRMTHRTEATVSGWINQRTDLNPTQRQAIIRYIDTLDSTAMQLATARWFTLGTIRIPDDITRVRQAMQVAHKAKVDPLTYDYPMAILNQFPNLNPDTKPINPDDLPTLNNKQSLPHGITIYNVDETPQAQQHIRDIIDTHLGTRANPWCITSAINGRLTDEARNFWKAYNAHPKRVAFRDGRIIAFFAADIPIPIWWDTQDRPHSAIPIAPLTEYNEQNNTIDTYNTDGTILNSTPAEQNENEKPETEQTVSPSASDSEIGGVVEDRGGSISQNENLKSEEEVFTSPISPFTSQQADATIAHIEQIGDDYTRYIDNIAEQVEQALTPQPTDDARTIAEKAILRFRSVKDGEFLNRNNLTPEEFSRLTNSIANAMDTNDHNHRMTWFTERHFDSMQRLANLISDIPGTNPDSQYSPWITQNQAKSRAQAAIRLFDANYKQPLYDAIDRCMRKIMPNIDTKNRNHIDQTYTTLSLYVQARTALERQAVQEEKARNEAANNPNPDDTTDPADHDFAGLAGIQFDIIGRHGLIDEEVEKIRHDRHKLEAFAIDNNVPTVQEFVDEIEKKIGTPFANDNEATQLWQAIQSISEYQLATSYIASLTSRSGYQVLTYGIDIDALLRERHEQQTKAIKDNPGSYDNVTDYDKNGNATGTRKELNSSALQAIARIDQEYINAIKAVPMPATNNSTTPADFSTLINTGWLSQEEVDNMHRYYQFYTPLKGHAEMTAEDTLHIRGENYTREKPRNQSRIKAVEGHTQEAVDPLNQLLIDTHGTIYDAEQNRWRNDLYQLLSAHPNPQQYIIEQRYYRITNINGVESFEPYGNIAIINGVETFIPAVPTEEELASGQAVAFNNRNTQARIDIPIFKSQREEHCVPVYVNGQPFTIFFYDKRIADAINGRNIPRMPNFLQRMAVINRLYAGLKTSLNPTFTMISNLPRDWMEMVSNNFISHGLWYAALSFAYRVRATRFGDVQNALRRYQEGTLLTEEQARNDAERYVIEFINNGGQVNITQLPDYDSAKVELINDINYYMSKGKMPKGNLFARLFNDAAERVELAPRLATYIASRKIGRSINEAVNDAKEATVNFDRKGSWAGIMGLMQLFYNAAAQSVRRQVHLAKNHPVRFAAVYATIAMASPHISLYLSWLLSLLLGDDDDFDDVAAKYFAVNPELRRHYQVILVGETILRIPLAVNYLPYVTLGDVLANAKYNHNYRPNNLKDSLDVTAAILDTFIPSMIAMPVGFLFDYATAKNDNERSNALKAAFGSAFNRIPVLEPLGQAMANYNFMGGTLYDAPYDKNSTEPAYLRARSYTQPVWITTSQWLNDITGGNEIKAGWLNIPPEALENIWGALGGVGEYAEVAIPFAGNVVQALSGNLDADALAKTTPMLSRLYGGNTTQRYNKSMQSLYYNDMTALDNYNNYRKDAVTPELRDDFEQEYTPDERRYFADLATIKTIADRIRKKAKDEAPEGEKPRMHENDEMLHIYELANRQAQSLIAGEKYTPIDDPYYIYMYITDQLYKKPYKAATGYYKLLDWAEIGSNQPKDHINYIPVAQVVSRQQLAQLRQLHKHYARAKKHISAIKSYYPGMHLSDDDQRQYDRFVKEVELLNEQFSNINIEQMLQPNYNNNN